MPSLPSLPSLLYKKCLEGFLTMPQWRTFLKTLWNLPKSLIQVDYSSFYTHILPI